MPIRVLPPEVVDQIAAGEVVERPAHMLKELLENSFDAHASKVEIDFSQGGRYVRVRDNGNGIPFEELALALSRHATSKIESTADIWNLASYGFRGEALATIAAVSRLTLISRERGSTEGGRISSEFGALSPAERVACEFGTTVVVEDLFGNVPARLKFLRSEGSESGQIKAVVRALALANPGVEFRLLQEGKLLQVWPAAENRGERAQQVFDRGELYPGFYEEPDVKVEVQLAPPSVTERTSRQVALFVQNRSVQDRGILAAVLDAYRNLLMHGEYPVAAVWVDMNPALVDVNVSPTKSTVKFQNSSFAYKAVRTAVRRVLESAPWLKETLGTGAGVERASGSTGATGVERANGENVSSVAANPSQKLNRPTGVAEQERFSDPSFFKTQYHVRQQPGISLEQIKEVRSAVEEYMPIGSMVNDGTFSIAGAPANATPAPNSSAPNSALMPTQTSPPAPSATQGRWQDLDVIGQANLTYIVTQSDRGLVLIDQHAAHERVLFERLMAAWADGQIETQNFLLPLNVDIDPAQVAPVIALAPEFKRFGIQIEQSGPGSVCVTECPVQITETALIEVIKKSAVEVEDWGGTLSAEKTVAEICATLACHSAIRAGRSLAIDQMRQLLAEMDEFPLSCFCPHGRPVSQEILWTRLERDFGRTV